MRLRTKFLASFLLALLVFSLGLALRGAISQVASGTWAPAASMAQARSGASAALLQGGPLLITGGDGANGPLADAELFGTDGIFSPAAPMNVARSRHISVVLQDGRVLVAGGITTGGGTTNAAEIYDPLANLWTSVAGGMVEARSGHTVSVLVDGRVLIAGGESGGVVSSTLEIFDPNTNAFSFGGVLSSPRKSHAAAVLADGRVLIVGGSDGSKPLASSDIYDPSTGTVSAGPVLSTPRQGLSATTQLDGKVVVIGGNTVDATGASVDLASAEVYDPAAQPPANFAVLTSTLATARQGHLAFLLPHNNNVLIVGGTSAGTALASAELFTPWQGIFSPTGPLAAARSSATVSALSQDGLLLSAGGKDAAGTALSSAELYGFATVKTDKSDYAPGETVTITGTGWQPGETVTLSFQEVPAFDTPSTLTAIADANGNISNSQFVPDQYDVGVTFYLTAVGQTSGYQAQTSFMDAPPANSTSIAVTCSPASVPVNTATTCTATVTNTKSGSNNGNPLGAVAFAFSGTGTAGSFSGSPCTLVGIGGSSPPASSCTANFTPTAAATTNINGTYTSSNTTSTGWANSGPSPNFSLSVFGTATKLAFGQQPSNTVAGSAISPAVTVKVEDANGNLVANSSASIGLTLNDPGGCTGTFTGGSTTTVAASSGVSTFNNLVINTACNGYTLGAGSSGLTGVTSAAFNITGGTATKLVITGSGTQTAGTSQNLTITAEDSFGNTATAYAGTKHLTFSGANPSMNPVTNPTVSDLGGIAQPFGTSTNLTFTSGVATVSGAKNGVMTLYKAETAVIAACDTTPICAAGADRLTVVVSAAGLGQFGFSLTSPQTNGVAFTGTNTLTAEDSWGNTVTTFDASANNATITANAPLSGTITGLGAGNNNVLNQAGNFTSGVANLTALGMKYTGTTGTGTFTATSSNGKTGTSNSVTITAPQITVTKSLLPMNDPGLFNLQINGTTYATNVGNTGTTGSQNGVVGSTNSVGELAGTSTNLADYQSSISCTLNGGAAGSGGSGSGATLAGITLAAGDVLACTITNKRLPQIKVKKVTNPITDTGTFDFTIAGTTYNNSGAGYGNGQDTGFQTVPFALDTVSEAGHTGTNLNDYVPSISCTNGATSSTSSVTLDLSAAAPGTQVTCTITNVRKGYITVTKTTDPASDNSTGFQITLSSSNGGTSNQNASETLTGNGGTFTYEVTPATYSIGETVPANWFNNSNTCSGLVVNPAQTVTCGITNTSKVTHTALSITYPTYPGSYGVAANTVLFSDKVTLTATVTHDCTTCAGLGTFGGTVTFVVTTSTPNVTLATSVPVVAGVATTTVAIKDPALYPAGSPYTVTATLTPTGGTLYQSSSGTATLNVAQELALGITYTGNEVVFVASGATSGIATFSAQVVQQNDSGPYENYASFNQLNSGSTRVWVTFSAGSAGSGCPGFSFSAPVFDTLTPGTGIASTTGTVNAPCAYTLTVAVTQSPVYFVPSFVMDTLTVAPTNGTGATGGGWVPDAYSTNGKSNFGMTIRFNQKGTNLQGNSVLVYRTTYGAACPSISICGTPPYAVSPNEPVDVQVKTNSMQSLGMSTTLNEIQLSAKASVQVIDAMTGTVLGGFGSGSSPNFFLTAIDNTSDQYGVNVYFTNGASLYKQILLQAIGGGQIVIHLQ